MGICKGQENGENEAGKLLPKCSQRLWYTDILTHTNVIVLCRRVERSQAIVGRDT